MNTYVFVKDGSDLVVQQDLGLRSGETLANVVVGTPTPTSANTATMVATAVANPLQVTIKKGDVGVSYGFPITVTTDQRVYVVTFVVTVQSDTFAPSYSEDPNSYQDLVGTLEAGKSAVGTSMWQLPTDADPSAGYVTWDLMDSEGVVYSSGNAYDFKIISSGISNTVVAKAIISVPDDIPDSLTTPYQLRYTLTLADGKVAYNYEQLQVVGFPDMQVGAVDSIEMKGDIATLSLVTEKLYQNYVLEIRQGGNILASMPVANPERVKAGYFVAGSVNTSQLAESCVPYTIIWKFWNVPAQTFRESAALWIATDAMIQAIADIRSKVNKARQTLYGTPDSQFPSTEIMKWMRRGMDHFNGAYGVFTSFTMTNAMGPVREYWLLCAEVAALEAQYLMEGEKAFNFSGAEITLDVDRTGFLDNAASKIQSRLDNELKPLKQNLIIKGNTGGPGDGPNGDGNFNALTRGATGSVGILLSPATLYGNSSLFSTGGRFP